MERRTTNICGGRTVQLRYLETPAALLPAVIWPPTCGVCDACIEAADEDPTLTVDRARLTHPDREKLSTIPPGRPSMVFAKPVVDAPVRGVVSGRVG